MIVMLERAIMKREQTASSLNLSTATMSTLTRQRSMTVVFKERVPWYSLGR